MWKFSNLPILLVSAENKIAADYIVSELIDNEGTDVHREQSDALDPVWRIVNKYYRADVRVHTRLDGEPLHVDPHLIEGHLIYLTQDEDSERCLHRRARMRRARVRRAQMQRARRQRSGCGRRPGPARGRPALRPASSASPGPSDSCGRCAFCELYITSCMKRRHSTRCSDKLLCLDVFSILKFSVEMKLSFVKI